MSDLNVSVTSQYGTETIKGETADAPGELSGSATFQYVKVAATKPLFDDESKGIVTTPITAQVYCPPSVVCSGFAIDTTNGLTIDPKWWLSTSHDQSRDDGDIKLAVKSVSGGGFASVLSPVVNIVFGGIASTAKVRYNSGPLPQTVKVGLDDAGTSDHMKTTDMGYDVRFTGKSGWAGPGDVGYVVDGNASSKKNSRLGW